MRIWASRTPFGALSFAFFFFNMLLFFFFFDKRHCAGYSWQTLYLPVHNFSPSTPLHAEKEEGGGGAHEEKMRAGKAGRERQEMAGEHRERSSGYPLIIIKSQFRLQRSAQSYSTRSELLLFHDPTSQRKRKR